MAKRRILPRTKRSISPQKANRTKRRESVSKKTKAAVKTAVSSRALAGAASKSELIKSAKPSDISAADLLARIESDITGVVATLNNQMNSALVAIGELSSAQSGTHARAVIRTAPLDRATATFKRLVAEMVEDQLAEMLPPLIAHRNEIAYSQTDGIPKEFQHRAVETLDHILALAGVQSYDVRIGEPFDPLIHLAIAESRLEDMANGAVAEQLQPGFRSSRGKILVPAKVRVNRR